MSDTPDLQDLEGLLSEQRNNILADQSNNNHLKTYI
jgi:hypothetical protein